MTPGEWTKYIYQGDDDTLIVRWKPGGQIIDLTGYSAELLIKSSKGAAQAEATLSTAAGTITIDGPTGLINVPLPKSLTTTLTPGTHYYDLKLTAPGGTVVTPIAGKIVVTQRV